MQGKLYKEKSYDGSAREGVKFVFALFAVEFEEQCCKGSEGEFSRAGRTDGNARAAQNAVLVRAEGISDGGDGTDFTAFSAGKAFFRIQAAFARQRFHALLNLRIRRAVGDRDNGSRAFSAQKSCELRDSLLRDGVFDMFRIGVRGGKKSAADRNKCAFT